MFRSSSEAAESVDAPVPRDSNTCPAGSHYRDDELERPAGCPHCGHHFPLRARQRMEQLVDGGTFVESEAELRSADPLAFFDLRAYTERLAEAEMSTGLGDAMVVGSGKIERRDCQLAVMDFSFMGGSMGSVVEKARLILPDCSRAQYTACVRHGLRGSEDAGGNSLMQLPKTVCAVEARRALRPSRRDDPPDDGGLASFASLGDVIVAEPGALLSFTGPRVVQQTVREKLPDDFGLAESNYLLGRSPTGSSRDGAGPSSGGCGPDKADRARSSSCARERLAKLGEFPLLRGTRMQESSRASAARSIGSRRADGGRGLEAVPARTAQGASLHARLRRANPGGGLHRASRRPPEPRRQRCCHAPRSLWRTHGRAYWTSKGRDIHERARRNFGMALPEGYRKAIRAMELADRHGFPVLTLIDTPRAYPGVAAEQHGQGAGSRAPRP